MGFPPTLWFEQAPDFGTGASLEPLPEDSSIADKTNRLFDVVRNARSGTPFTNAEVARMSLGDLSEEHVEQIRSGKLTDPSVNQVIALADVFGVCPSYPCRDLWHQNTDADPDGMELLGRYPDGRVLHHSYHASTFLVTSRTDIIEKTCVHAKCAPKV
jgi:hypothetical protein